MGIEISINAYLNKVNTDLALKIKKPYLKYGSVLLDLAIFSPIQHFFLLILLFSIEVFTIKVNRAAILLKL